MIFFFSSIFTTQFMYLFLCSVRSQESILHLLSFEWMIFVNCFPIVWIWENDDTEYLCRALCPPPPIIYTEQYTVSMLNGWNSIAVYRSFAFLKCTRDKIARWRSPLFYPKIGTTNRSANCPHFWRKNGKNVRIDRLKLLWKNLAGIQNSRQERSSCD